MQKFLILCLLLKCYPLIAQPVSSEREFKHIHALEVTIGKIYGYAETFRKSGFEKPLTFGVSANFLRLNVKDKFFFYQKFGFNFAAKNYYPLIENLTFENGYIGGLNGDMARTSFHYGQNFEFKIYKNFNITFMVDYSPRWWKYDGRYFLNENQVIDPNDIVTGSEARAANKVVFYKNFSHGLSTGLDLVLNIGTKHAIFTRFMVNYYPNSLDIYRLEEISYNSINGTFTIPSTSLQSSTDIRFTFGIRSSVFVTGKKEEKNDKDIETKPDVILTPEKGRK